MEDADEKQKAFGQPIKRANSTSAADDCTSESSETNGSSDSNNHYTRKANGVKSDKSPSAVVTGYRDYSRDLPMPSDGKTSLGSDGAAQTFPMKLHSILSNPEFSDIIAWLPHGRAWRILQTKAFEERAIPLYFRHGRYSSFARQVNGWGFRRITHGPDYNSYYHEMFLKGLPHVCEKMKRLTSKDIKKMQKDDVPLPDFYSLSRDFPLPETPVGTVTQASDPLSSLSSSRNSDTRNAPGVVPSSVAGAGPGVNFGPLAGLSYLSSLAPSLTAQNQNLYGQSSSLSSINHAPSPLFGSGAKLNAVDSNNVEQRRAAILAQMMQLAATQNGGSQIPAQSITQPVSSTSNDLQSQLLSILNTSGNQLVPTGVQLAAQTLSPRSGLQVLPTPSVSNGITSKAGMGTNSSGTNLSPEILSLLGQQNLSPSVLASVVQALSSSSSNSSSSNATSVLAAAPPQPAVSTGNPSLELMLQLLQQQSEGSANPRAHPNASTGSLLGGMDMAAFLRQHQQQTTTSNPSGSRSLAGSSSSLPIPVMSAVHQNQASIANSVAGLRAFNAATSTGNTSQGLDLASLLNLQQRAPNNNLGNHGNTLDMNAITALLGNQNAPTLQQLNAQQFNPNNSDVLSMLFGNTPQVRSAFQGGSIGQTQPNPMLHNIPPPSTSTDLQYLQQLLGRQNASNAVPQNANQLENALRLLLNNGNNGNANMGNLFSNFQS